MPRRTSLVDPKLRVSGTLTSFNCKRHVCVFSIRSGSSIFLLIDAEGSHLLNAVGLANSCWGEVGDGPKRG